MQTVSRPWLGTLPSTMMDVPLTITALLEHAAERHAEREIVSREEDGTLYRSTYGGLARRVAQLARALVELGVRPGDRVASFGWNTHRHLELYFAVPCIGAVLHTTNIRLFPQQIAALFEHAEDALVFVDASLVPTIEQVIAAAPGARRRFVVMSADVDAPGPPGALAYETLLAPHPQTYAWPELDERAAAVLCYTTATTGEPKGVLYSHRSTVLHTYAAAVPDALGFRERDVALPVVPMFHANAWGIPYLAAMAGTKLVLPGSRLDAPSLIALLESEGVTYSTGVPTVWLGIRDELKRTGRTLPHLERVIIGGSALPPSLYDDLTALGIETKQGWGMTEMSPIGSISLIKDVLADAPPHVKRAAALKQGVGIANVHWKLVDADGRALPHDGTSRGELLVRGPWITGAYYRNEAADALAFEDGWFKTGDICTIDELGSMQIVDRVKDMIKSGGEWMSSIDLENVLMSHPSIKEAVVIGVPHPRWIERPIAVAVVRDGTSAEEEDLRAWLRERVAKFEVPDRVLFVDALPRTGVGKFAKRILRERYENVLLEG